MKPRQLLKKIFFSLYPSNRIILLDYPINPERSYSEEDGKPHKKLFEILKGLDENYKIILFNTLKYKSAFQGIKEAKAITDEISPGWNNGHLPGLDIIMLYSIIAQNKPLKYIEIGSGTSTKVACKSKTDNNLATEIICIDPSPKENILKVADKIFTNDVQKISLEVFSELKPNDIVFLDGTHTLLPNSDVMYFFLEILPILPKGVIVQIHDVYLPYDYPVFMCERYYSEQYLLAALLLNSPLKYEIISPNYYIFTQKELHGILNEIWTIPGLNNVEKHGGSFWFKIL
jgi:hypothetical protein